LSQLETQASKDKKQKERKPQTKIGWYNKFSYFAFRWLDNKPRPGILQLLYKADIQMLPGMYLGSIIITAIIVTVSLLFISWFVFSFILATPLSLIFEIVIPLSGLGASLGALPLITLNKITGKKVKIDAVLPFVLAYMATLSSAGMNPVETIRAVGLKDFGPVSREFQKISYRSDVLGEDIISAINHIALNTPSETLRELLIGMSNIVISGGSLRTYCEQESKELFALKRAKLKGFIDSLAAFSEGYIGGIIVSLIMGVIGIIVLGALGLHVLPFLSTADLFDILIFVGVPLINIVFLAMLETRFSSGEV
jgi:archaeal flagellar protein FlaJ